MATDLLHATAVALATELNNEIVGLGAAVEYKEDVEREDLDGLTVYVVPADLTIEVHNRAENLNVMAIDLGVFFPLADRSAAEVKKGRDKAAEIIELYEENGNLRHKLVNGAQWRSIENSPAWEPKHLSQAQTFATRIRLFYAKVK